MAAGFRGAARGRSGPRGAFTLIELLIVIGIIVVLAGIGFTFTGPAREKARQTVCISNLHQIGLALQMYRTDWGGVDAARTAYEWGVPASAWFPLIPYMGGSWDLLHCPSAKPEMLALIQQSEAEPHWTLYMMAEWNTPPAPQVPEWGDAYAARGPEFPMIACLQHDNPRPDRPRNRQFVILWRVAGNVEAKYVPVNVGSWLW